MEPCSSASKAPQRDDWSSLPADLLKIILERLPWSSHPRFGAACTHWRSAVSPFYPAWLTPVLLNAVDVGSTNVRYYSPYHHKIFQVGSTLEIPNAMICCVDGHRLTLCQGAEDGGDQTTIVDVDLVTGVVERLQPLERTKFDFVCRSGRRMLGFDVLMGRVARAIHDDDNDGWCPWEFSELSPDEPMLTASPVTNPVLHRGLFFLLHRDGRLSVYDDDRRHEQGLKVLDKPQGFGFECDGCYLFGSDEGGLMAALIGRHGSPLHVVKLNEETMEWEKVQSLEGRTLFTGTLRTMMVKTDVKWMQDKVFLPRLYDWPEIVKVGLVERGGELAFVPKSTFLVSKNGDGCASSIWTCMLEQEAEFWGTSNIDNSIWVDFKELKSV